MKNPKKKILEVCKRYNAAVRAKEYGLANYLGAEVMQLGEKFCATYEFYYTHFLFPPYVLNFRIRDKITRVMKQPTFGEAIKMELFRPKGEPR